MWVPPRGTGESDRYSAAVLAVRLLTLTHCCSSRAPQSHNTFTITHLLIPKQEGTPDTCMTTDEEELFAFQDQRELMTLGWVRPSPYSLFLLPGRDPSCAPD